MGILNATPDSFSDGGQFLDPSAAVAHGLELIAEGADLLDVGGESTRPGSLPVSLEEELRRVVPVVSGLAAQTKTPISVDTSKAEVARRCLDAEAQIINDVTALRGDPDLAAVWRVKPAPASFSCTCKARRQRCSRPRTMPTSWRKFICSLNSACAS